MFLLLLPSIPHSLWATVDSSGCTVFLLEHKKEIEDGIKVTTQEIDDLFDSTKNPRPHHPSPPPSKVEIPTSEEFEELFGHLKKPSLPTPSNIPKISDSEFHEILKQLQNRPHFPPRDKSTLDALIEELMALNLSPEQINDFLHRPMHGPSTSLETSLVTTPLNPSLAKTATSGSDLHFPGPRNFAKGPDGISFDL